jgi:nucleotide-binding universal stress UspA family protein
VQHGLAIDQILRFAAANSNDLVVMASHGLTGVSHLLIGSVAEKVVRQSPSPVLTIKTFGKHLLAAESLAVVQAQTLKP